MQLRHILAAVTLAFLIIPAGHALASFGSDVHANHEIRSLILHAPPLVTATSTDACDHVTITWQSTGADSYRVQVRDEAGGAWTDVSQSTGSVTSIDDSNPPAGQANVTYRVASLDTRSAWQSAASTESSPLAC